MRTKLFGVPAILAALGWAPLAAASLLFASMSPAPADTFENFVIQNSSNPSTPGGDLLRRRHVLRKLLVG